MEFLRKKKKLLGNNYFRLRKLSADKTKKEKLKQLE